MLEIQFGWIFLTDTSQSKACGDDVSKQDGGKYLITDLCHFITARDTYTKLVLIRDSFGRKGNPSKGSENANKGMSLGDGAGFLWYTIINTNVTEIFYDH